MTTSVKQENCSTPQIDSVELFGVLHNEVRLRMLHLLAGNGEICVCEFVDTLSISQPSASKALKLLKEHALVTDRRDANWTYYRLNPELPGWAQTILDATMEHLSGSATCRADQRRFARNALQRPRNQACKST